MLTHLQKKVQEMLFLQLNISLLQLTCTLAFTYLSYLNRIVTLEKETENSLINVVRLYYLEEYAETPSSKSKEDTEDKERGDKGDKEIQVGRVETIRATSSISCIAVCPISSRLAIAKRSPP